MTTLIQNCKRKISEYVFTTECLISQLVMKKHKSKFQYSYCKTK